MDKIILLGAGSTASNYLWMLEELEKSPILMNNNGFAGDEKFGEIIFFDEYRKKDNLYGKKVLNNWKDLKRYADESFAILTVSYPSVKEKFFKKLKETGINLAIKTINFSAYPDRTHKSLLTGEGCTIWSHSSLQPDVKLGKGVTISTAAIIGQEVEIGDFSSVTANAMIAGGVKIGKRCYIGSGAVIVNVATLGDGCFITAGSVVASDVPQDMKAIGNPARYFNWDGNYHNELWQAAEISSVFEERIKRIMNEVLGVLPEDITIGSSPDNVEGWDSFKHMNLIISLEEEFDVRFSDNEIGMLISYKNIAELIEIKKQDSYLE